jgi:hypothetical protein
LQILEAPHDGQEHRQREQEQQTQAKKKPLKTISASPKSRDHPAHNRYSSASIKAETNDLRFHKFIPPNSPNPVHDIIVRSSFHTPPKIPLTYRQGGSFPLRS